MEINNLISSPRNQLGLPSVVWDSSRLFLGFRNQMVRHRSKQRIRGDPKLLGSDKVIMHFLSFLLLEEFYDVFQML